MIVVNVPKVCQENARQVGSMNSCCWHQILTLMDTVPFWWARIHCSLSWQKWNLTSPSAVAAHLPQGLRHCTLRHFSAKPQKLYKVEIWAMVRFLSAQNESGHSSVTSLINKAFASTELTVTGALYFMVPFWGNFRNCCEWFPSRSAVIETFKPACLAPTIMPFFPFWGLMWTQPEAAGPYLKDCLLFVPDWPIS